MAGKGNFGKAGGGAEGMNSKLVKSPMSPTMMAKTSLAGSGRGRRKTHVGHKSGGKY